MYEAIVDEVLCGEGQAGVVLLDMQGIDLVIWTDHWGHYTTSIMATIANAYELKDSLEAAGFLVVIAEKVVPPSIRPILRCAIGTT